ncbi:4-coumarate--CoA ligase 1 [Drosophila mojavensis]|uniref:4-coumarate--CoA ligase 1 n=1 Tax=Drosophila mojavensis TaxID=7230 RepID=UPI001CD12A52|nr:4-coumarate--CoA ligase 1 [Drosophila mojavensis]
MDDFFKTHYDPIARIWSGAKSSPMYDFDCSYGRIVHNQLRNNPNHICQICLADGKTATNRDVFTWSVRLAQNFKKRGLRHDDVICISAKNSTYVTPVAVACLFNATPFHAVNPILDPETLSHVLAITKPSLFFCDAADLEKLKTASAAWSPEFVTLTGKVEGVPFVEEFLAPTNTEMFYQPQPLIFGGEQTMAILCSSGTTGKPKAVCMANYMLSCSNPFLSSEAVIYCGSSLDWYSGLINFMYSVADGCTRIIADKPFSAEYILELVTKYKINILSIAPRHASELVACPQATPEKLASVFLVAVGGGWIPSVTLQKVQKLIQRGFVYFGYGTTEFGGVCAGPFNEKLGNTVGKLNAGIKIRIVDEDGKNLGYGMVGEVYVNHGRNWKGYYGNPVESQRMYDSLGWFHTGDLGYFDEENNLYIVDRKKEIYKCLGMQYSPNDIEAVITELPDVVQVCVVGVYDDKYGDAPAAMIVKRPGSSLTAEQVKQHVAKRLVVNHKQLHGGAYFTNELPVTASGKVMRRTVKEQLTQSSVDR